MMAEQGKSEKKAFGKTDMERVALFKEMGYVTIGDNYAQAQMQFNASASKGKQMQISGPKEKSALPAGYFSDKFARVFDGESYTDQVKIKSQQRQEKAKKNIAKNFVPSNGEKKMSGLGSYYGCFTKDMESFSPAMRPGPSHAPPKKNLYTSPGKKGTGYGYVPVTFNTYPGYLSENYDQYKEEFKKDIEQHNKSMKGGAFHLSAAPVEYFDKNPYKSDKPLPPIHQATRSKDKTTLKSFKPSSPSKLDGGMKAGTFDPYPSHSADEYRVKSTSATPIKVFMPPADIKSAPVHSILHQNVIRSIHAQNYKTAETVMVY